MYRNYSKIRRKKFVDISPTIMLARCRLRCHVFNKYVRYTEYRNDARTDNYVAIGERWKNRDFFLKVFILTEMQRLESLLV